MNKTVKKAVIGVVSASLVCGGIYGGLVAYRTVNASPASVVRVSDLYESVMSDPYLFQSANYTSGTVRADRIQSAFLSGTQTVEKVEVSVGDQVKKGDTLFTYDTTLTEIQYQKDEVDLEKKKLGLEKKEAILERLYTLSPSSETNYDNGYFDDIFDDTDSLAENVEETEEPDEEYQAEQTPALLGGDGSRSDPYIYLWGEEDPLTAQVLLQMFVPDGRTIVIPGEEDVDNVDNTGEHTSRPSEVQPSADGQADPDGNQDGEPQDPEGDLPWPEEDGPVDSQPDTQDGDGGSGGDFSDYADGDGQAVPGADTQDSAFADADYADADTGYMASFVKAVPRFAGPADGLLTGLVTDVQDADIPMDMEGSAQAPSGENAEEAVDAQYEEVWDVAREAVPGGVTVEEGEGSKGEGNVTGDSSGSSAEGDGTDEAGDGSGNSTVQLEDLRQEVYIVLEVHKGDSSLAPIRRSYGLHLFRLGEEVSVRLFDPDEMRETISDETEEDGDTEEGEEGELTDSEAEQLLDEILTGLVEELGYEFDDVFNGGTDDLETELPAGLLEFEEEFDWDGAYTAQEIEEHIQTYKKAVLQGRLDVRKAELDLKAKKEELENSAVYAALDGEVKTVRDPDEAKQTGNAMVVVSGGGGYFVEASIGELDLDAMEPGTQVQVQSYFSNAVYSGVLKNISEYPSTSDSFFFSSANSNISYYPAEIRLEDSAELRDDDYVEVTYSTKTQSGLYIDKRFIRTEGASSYVYVADDNEKLVRRPVVTGRVLDYSSFIEVRSGLDLGDRLAFPYGKDVYEGAPVKDVTMDEMYGYDAGMYY